MTNYLKIAILLSILKRGKTLMAEEKKENGAKNGNGEKKGRQRRPSALKRDLQSKNRNLKNRAFKAKVNTVVRSLQETVSQKDTNATKAKLGDIYSLMDKGVKKGIFKLNKANRVKSRLHALSKKG